MGGSQLALRCTRIILLGKAFGIDALRVRLSLLRMQEAHLMYLSVNLRLLPGRVELVRGSYRVSACAGFQRRLL